MINVEFTCDPSLNKLQYQFPHLLTLKVNKLSPSIVIQYNPNLNFIFSNGYFSSHFGKAKICLHGNLFTFLHNAWIVSEYK